jgi:DNA-binding Xre family transcriptional regulator
MTALGRLLKAKFVNKSQLARNAGLSNSRLHQLTVNPSSHPRAFELYRIALAIDFDPGDLLNYLYGNR